MMKIHTTQNLNTLGTTIQPTNIVSSKDIRYEKRIIPLNLSNDKFESSVSFMGKGDIHKISRFFNKKTGKFRTDAIKRHQAIVDEFANGKESFSAKPTKIDKLLDVMGHEVVIQAAIACLICTLLRPGAIMLLPNKKDKRDNMYAASHSVSSGIIGVITAFLISFPFSRGVQALNKNFLKELPLTILKQMFPELNTKSIIDGAKLPETISKIKEEASRLNFKKVNSLEELLKGKSIDEIVTKIVNEGIVDNAEIWSTKDGKKLAEVINSNIKSITKDSKSWTFMDGKAFMAGTNSPQLMPSTVLVSEIINPKTFEHYGITTDVKEIEAYMKEHNGSLVGMKVMTKDGEKKLIDALPINDMTLAIEKLGDDHYAKIGYNDVTFYPLYHIDKGFLTEVVENNKNSEVVQRIDVEKAFDTNGKLKHPKDWVDKATGKQIEKYEDLIDYLGLSTAYESDRVMPMHTGALKAEGKLASFLPNVPNENLSGVPSQLGTMISQKAVDAAALNDMKQKLVTWVPDILTRVPVGFGTIALVPFVLKKVFHLEKSSSKPQAQPSGKAVA